MYKAKKLLEFLPLKFPLMDLYTDRVANQRGVGVRVVIVSLDGIVLEKSMRLSFSLTNNEAKYEALWSGSEAIKGLGGNNIKVFSDS